MVMSTKKFQDFLNKNNLDITIIQSQEATHTAQQAADTHKVSVQNIVKSILVKIDNEFVMFLVPGDRKIDLKKKNGVIATPDEVKNITGYSIGGVPPFGHTEKIKTFIIEEGFDKKQQLLAAAGSQNSVFKITFDKLKKILNKI